MNDANKAPLIKSLQDIKQVKENMTNIELLDFVTQCEAEYEVEKSKKSKYKRYEQVVKTQEKVTKTAEEKRDVSTYKVSHNNAKKIIDIENIYNTLIAINDEKTLTSFLNQLQTSSDNKLINLLILQLTKDINEAYTMLKIEEKAELQSEIDKEINSLEEKKEFLIDFRDGVETEEESLGNQEKPLHLIFVPNEKENVSFLQDVKKYIQREKRGLVFNGLKDIINGKTKKYQRFTTVTHNVQGFGEVKLDATCRILLDKTENSEHRFIFILGITQKKCYKNRVFVNFLEDKCKNYMKYREQVIPLIIANNTQDLINNNEEILDFIFQNLEEGVKYERTTK